MILQRIFNGISNNGTLDQSDDEGDQLEAVAKFQCSESLDTCMERQEMEKIKTDPTITQAVMETLSYLTYGHDIPEMSNTDNVDINFDGGATENDNLAESEEENENVDTRNSLDEQSQTLEPTNETDKPGFRT